MAIKTLRRFSLIALCTLFGVISCSASRTDAPPACHAGCTQGAAATEQMGAGCHSVKSQSAADSKVSAEGRCGCGKKRSECGCTKAGKVCDGKSCDRCKHCEQKMAAHSCEHAH